MKGHGWFALSCSMMVGITTGCSHQQPPAAQSPAAAETAPASKAPAPKTARAEEPALPPNKDPSSIYFEFDSALLRDDAREVLANVANSVNAQHVKVAVEGNCDELGTVEYNLALGQQRAEAAKQYLVRLGVDPHRVQTASYGSQRPRYRGHDDDSRAKNRRDDLIYR